MATAVTSRHDSAPGPVYSGSARTPTVNATSSAVIGAPSSQDWSGRRWNVQVRPDSSTSQRVARSPTIELPGPSLTRPRNRSATRARSAADRAPNGLALVARPKTPSTYGRAAETGDVGSTGLPEDWRDGASAAIDSAISATLRPPISARSRSFIRGTRARRPNPAGDQTGEST